MNFTTFMNLLTVGKMTPKVYCDRCGSSHAPLAVEHGVIICMRCSFREYLDVVLPVKKQRH